MCGSSSEELYSSPCEGECKYLIADAEAEEFKCCEHCGRVSCFIVDIHQPRSQVNSLDCDVATRRAVSHLGRGSSRFASAPGG